MRILCDAKLPLLSFSKRKRHPFHSFYCASLCMCNHNGLETIPMWGYIGDTKCTKDLKSHNLDHNVFQYSTIQVQWLLTCSLSISPFPSLDPTDKDQEADRCWGDDLLKRSVYLSPAFFWLSQEEHSNPLLPQSPNSVSLSLWPVHCAARAEPASSPASTRTTTTSSTTRWRATAAALPGSGVRSCTPSPHCCRSTPTTRPSSPGSISTRCNRKWPHWCGDTTFENGKKKKSAAGKLSPLILASFLTRFMIRAAANDNFCCWLIRWKFYKLNWLLKHFFLFSTLFQRKIFWVVRVKTMRFSLVPVKLARC